MKYEEYDLLVNNDDYLYKLMHPIILRDIYNNFSNSNELLNFISKNKNKNWFIFSDYCLNKKQKENDSMVFTILALDNENQLRLINKIISILQPKDLKDSKCINISLIEFIKNLPVFNVSIILPKNRNLIKAFNFNELEFLKMRYKSLENYYIRLHNLPLIGLNFNKIIKDFKYIQNKFNSKSISLGLYRDFEIINSAITSISLLISQNQKNENFKIMWISDRDSLLTFEKANLSSPLIFNIIHASYKSFIESKINLIFYTSNEVNYKPEFDGINRIPDLIAGALADMNEKTVSHLKFIPIIRDYLSLTSKNHITRLHLESNKYGINSVFFKINN